jgi:hypothetical protein
MVPDVFYKPYNENENFESDEPIEDDQTRYCDNKYQELKEKVEIFHKCTRVNGLYAGVLIFSVSRLFRIICNNYETPVTDTRFHETDTVGLRKRARIGIAPVTPPVRLHYVGSPR